MRRPTPGCSRTVRQTRQTPSSPGLDYGAGISLQNNALADVDCHVRQPASHGYSCLRDSPPLRPASNAKSRSCEKPRLSSGALSPSLRAISRRSSSLMLAKPRSDSSFLPSLSPVLQVSGVNPFEESCGERFALKIVRSVAAELRNGIGSTRKPPDLSYSICSGSVLDGDQCRFVFAGFFCAGY
jgi:hypothetical protein